LNADARGEKPDKSDGPFAIEDLSINVSFSDNGTGQEEIYVRVHIQSQAVVQPFGVLKLSLSQRGCGSTSAMFA
jgi:hypothetical protein